MLPRYASETVLQVGQQSRDAIRTTGFRMGRAPRGEPGGVTAGLDVGDITSKLGLDFRLGGRDLPPREKIGVRQLVGIHWR